MICCEECFNDIEIKNIISDQVKTRGNCGICGSTNVYVYDTYENDQLVNSFNNLLDIYTTSDSLPEHFPEHLLTTLEYEVIYNWRIFKSAKVEALELIKEICSDKYKETPKLFDGLISVYDMNGQSYLNGNSLLKVYQWSDFVNEIKERNRFHTNIMNVDILKEFCRNTWTYIKKDMLYYRARISGEKGYSNCCMGAPPISKVKDGRANPVGISCLYLSDNEKTTLHEIRAGAFDYVTLGKFRAIEDISIVDFTIFDQTSPLMVDDIKRYATNKDHLRNISDEISRPLRSTDGPLDYLPAQYIVEFIKSEGYQGVKYKSTVSESGNNVAIFDEKLFECIDTKVYAINHINYSYSEVN